VRECGEEKKSKGDCSVKRGLRAGVAVEICRERRGGIGGGGRSRLKCGKRTGAGRGKGGGEGGRTGGGTFGRKGTR